MPYARILPLLLVIAGAAAVPAAEPSATTTHATARAAPLAGADGEWTSDLKAALASAKASGRPILIDFTGSDWCPWCIKLHDEVFATQEFKRWAAGHAILLVADFPREAPQPEALAAQNDALAHRYRIRGYPTVVAIDADGKELGRSGYRPGGAKAWIEDLGAKVSQLR